MVTDKKRLFNESTDEKFFFISNEITKAIKETEQTGVFFLLVVVERFRGLSVTEQTKCNIRIKYIRSQLHGRYVCRSPHSAFIRESTRCFSIKNYCIDFNMHAVKVANIFVITFDVAISAHSLCVCLCGTKWTECIAQTNKTIRIYSSSASRNCHYFQWYRWTVKRMETRKTWKKAFRKIVFGACGEQPMDKNALTVLIKLCPVNATEYISEWTLHLWAVLGDCVCQKCIVNQVKATKKRRDDSQSSEGLWNPF